MIEQVEVWNRDPARKIGEALLTVGEDYLPRMTVTLREGSQSFRFPAKLPAVWELRAVDPNADNLLLMAWQVIRDIQEMLANAEREEASEARREPDEMDLAKAEMERRGER